MDKLRADYSKETVNLSVNIIEPRYSAACVSTEARMSPLSSLDLTQARWEPLGGQLPDEQEPEVLCFRRMSEFAKRIEESAASSSVWSRINGAELSGLRLSFQNLLRQLLVQLDAGASVRCREYETICRGTKNGDIVLAYRFAYLLSATLIRSQVSAAARVEVGFRSGSTEFSCFLAERSAGVTIRKDDNLFALCTNGEWRGEMISDAPTFLSVQQTVEKHGGHLLLDAMQGTTVKVSFAV